MRVLLYHGSIGGRPITIRIHGIGLVVVVGLVLLMCLGVATLFSPAGWRDLLESSLVVGGTLLATVAITGLFPQVFSLYTLRLAGMFVVAYSLMILIPLPLVYADFPYPARSTFLFATTGGFLCTLMGIILMHRLAPMSSQHVRRWLSAPTQVWPVFKPAGVILLAVCFAILALYLLQVGNLPILQAIQGDQTSLELALARENALKLIPGSIVYVYTLLRNTLFPFTTFLLLVVAGNSRRWRWKVLFIVSLIGSMIMAAATLEKSPVAANVIMLAFVWLLVRGKTFSRRMLLPLGIAALAFPVFVYFAVYQFSIAPVDVAQGVVHRLFYLPGEVLYHYFDFVPDHQDFLLGRTLPYISKLYTDGPFPIANAICRYMYPNEMASCLANGAYVGFWWADFGWVGVLVGGFVSGVAVQGIQAWIMRLPKSAPTVVLQAMLAYQVTILTYTTIFDLVDPLGRGFVIVLAALLILWGQSRRRPSLVSLMSSSQTTS